jgi:spore germination protein GerM
MANKNKKKSGLTAAIWILFTLIILIVFLVKQNDIMSVLKETDFFKYVFGQNPEFIEKYKTQKVNKDDSVLLQNESDEKTEFTLSNDKNLVEKNIPPVLAKENVPSKINDTELPKVSETTSSPVKEATENKKPEVKTPAPVVVQMRNEYLCFIVIESNGSVTRKDIDRQVSKSDMPLTKALNDLLSGPSYDESNKGYISLIPEGTRLISASVKDTVATINFSSEFLYNKYGVDGFHGQLMQIVYTATAFNTIKAVQILIEGEKTEFLGSEGVWIGSPLSRNDF